MAPAPEHQLAPPVFSRAPQEGVLREQLERPADAEKDLPGALGVVLGEELEEPLEIGERSRGYFDARHARALGRRVFFPARRAAR